MAPKKALPTPKAAAGAAQPVSAPAALKRVSAEDKVKPQSGMPPLLYIALVFNLCIKLTWTSLDSIDAFTMLFIKDHEWASKGNQDYPQSIDCKKCPTGLGYARWMANLITYVYHKIPKYAGRERGIGFVYLPTCLDLLHSKLLAAEIGLSTGLTPHASGFAMVTGVWMGERKSYFKTFLPQDFDGVVTGWRLLGALGVALPFKEIAAKSTIWCEGAVTLLQMLFELQRPIDPAHKAAIIAQLSGVHATLKANGVTHGDVKPANLVITVEGKPCTLYSDVRVASAAALRIKLIDCDFAARFGEPRRALTPGLNGPEKYVPGAPLPMCDAKTGDQGFEYCMNLVHGRL